MVLGAKRLGGIGLGRNVLLPFQVTPAHLELGTFTLNMEDNMHSHHN